MPLSLDDFLTRLSSTDVLPQEKLRTLLDALPPTSKTDGEKLARELVRQKVLTPYQAKAIYSGKGAGLVLGDYLVLEEIGAGGMGQVFKAQHRRMKRQVAIKLLSPALNRDAEAIKRFEREVEAAARLSHPNIVIAYDAGCTAVGQHYLVMEHVAGSDLSSHVKQQGPLAPPAALHCLLQAAQGLAYAHEQGVVHRDIKPANLLLDAKGTVKILDMGLARLSSAGPQQDDLTGTSQIMGTVDYMAPEQALNTKTADARADIYSLGITLWYLLTGHAAYGGGTAIEKLMAHQLQPIPELSSARVSAAPALQAVFARMVAKRPEDRYPNMAEVIAALQACQQGDGHPPTNFARAAPVAGAALKPPTTATGLEATLTIAPPQPAIGETQVTASSNVATALFPPGSLRGSPDPAPSGSLTSPRGEGPALREASRSQPAKPQAKATRLALRNKLLAATCGVATLVLLAFLAPRLLNRSPVISPNSQPPAPVALGWHGWPADAPKPAIAPFDAAQAKKHQEEWAAYLKAPVEYTNSIGMKFRLIPPGEFLMGSTPEEIEAGLKLAGDDKLWQDHLRSETQHKVILTKPIYLGMHEVTQKQYAAIMGKNPSSFATTGSAALAPRVAGIDTSSFPVETMDWNDAAEFCAKLSQKEALRPNYQRTGTGVTMLDGTGYRLPTEAEWENACRAGTTTKYWIGDTEEEALRAGWLEKSGDRTHAVGELQANPFGLYDLYGNVGERVSDPWDTSYYGQFSDRPAVDPAGPPEGPPYHRVSRGGGWYTPAPVISSGHRQSNVGVQTDSSTGFRVVLPVDAVRQALTEQPSEPSTKTSWHGWPVDAPKPAIAPFDAAQAKKHQEEWAAYLKVPVEYTNTIGMKFKLIPPGEFLMGSTAEEMEAALMALNATDDPHWHNCTKSEAPEHKVILTQPIYLGVHEVTQAEYTKVTGANPSRFASMGLGKEAVAGLETAEHPVETVSWNDAAEFCAKLSKQEILKPFYFRAGETITPLDGTGYRLPSEAEWEFACRAGTVTKFWIGDEDENLARAGWFGLNSGKRTHAAGESKANPFGLSDISGNVWEWVQDGWDATAYGQFKEKPAINPNVAFSADSQRVLRGGDWSSPVFHCRSSQRYAYGPSHHNHHLGFRVSLPVDAVKASLVDRASSSVSSKSAWHGWPKDAPKPAITPFDAAQAKKHQEAWAAYLKVPAEYENSLGMKFRLIPPGEFTRGSTKAEIEARLREVGPNDPHWRECIQSEAPQHQVTLTQPFYLAVHEATQADCQAVLGKNPSHFSPQGKGQASVAGVDTARHPVEGLSWQQAVDFCTKLSQTEFPALAQPPRAEGTGYRLPTEAEWEFACRAGTTTTYWLGNSDAALGPAAHMGGGSGGHTHAVGELPANPLGLKDVHGNVWEWVADGWDSAYYAQFAKQAATDPRGPQSATALRLARGGDCYTPAHGCRAAFRFAIDPSGSDKIVGFRPALSIDAVRAALHK